VDFTSALYLGITHDSRSLQWNELTTGTPAVIRRTAATAAAERAFVALVGCERAVALTSTLHAFLDLFAQIGEPGVVVLHDAGVYPIACWGMERARLRGARVVPFRHHDPAALERRLAQLGSRVRPWVVSDGFCSGCGRAAPLDTYTALIRRFGARMVIDDTQAIGVLGAAPTSTAPLGSGGGGSLRRWSLAGDDLLLIASLAKGFGAPLAMLAGGRRIVERFIARSDTLMHCSPPSAAAVAAALHAFSIHAARGEALRARLVARVRGLRQALRRRGFPPRGGLFPIQRVPIASARAAMALQRELARRGVRVVAARSRCTSQIALMFLVTARHGEAEIDFAASALAAAAWGGRGSRLELPSTAEV
jgi:8-amino-7-oxononanoate synthase